ncbi:MAG: glycosyltransferase family 1 protein [Flavobacterium sp.]|nr:MAG: glycosyltransferase family 1 protein [Flavobacterium sp.]
MTFTIITHALLGRDKGRFYAYAPYVREMNIWTKLADKVIIVAPVERQNKTPIQINFEHDDIEFKPVPPINSTNFKGKLRAIFEMPFIAFRIFGAMRKADHIHLRCPGNIGLIGCIVQIFFPSKEKTAKYAGNWDPKGDEPLSYRMQKWILNNRFLTRNIRVLVYGEWPGMSENIKPFFTATYRENDKIEIGPKSLSGEIRFLFVGTLTAGKRPMYAVQAIEKLRSAGFNATLSLYGEGPARDTIQKYIAANDLENHVRIMGAQREIVVRQAYIESQFLLLPSKSEGWPKVVAEAMFWGCMPLATGVSCVPYMVGFGKRGMLLHVNLAEDVTNIITVLGDQEAYDEKCRQGMLWSRQFTLDLFEDEINNLMKK